jgi:hypothetical protein
MAFPPARVRIRKRSLWELIVSFGFFLAALQEGGNSIRHRSRLHTDRLPKRGVGFSDAWESWWTMVSKGRTGRVEIARLRERETAKC